MNNELVKQISTLLQKHEVHNEVLAHELAIMVLKREKTVIKQNYRNTMNTLATPNSRSTKDGE